MSLNSGVLPFATADIHSNSASGIRISHLLKVTLTAQRVKRQFVNNYAPRLLQTLHCADMVMSI